MTKEEFLAMSLPYGLKFIDPFRNTLHDLTGINNGNTSNFALNGGIYSNGLYMDYINCKPILHPLSDLTKPITHKGETFVPIVELARISFPEFNWNKNRINKKTNVLEGNPINFWFDGNDFCGCTVNYQVNIRSQLLLFQSLLAWHFDIAGLIEKGEAIDVNTLDKNPYE